MTKPFRLPGLLALAASTGLMIPSAAFADDPSGSGGDSGIESVSGAYIAIGAGALIAGLLLWDALTDENADQGGEALAVEQEGTTGIDWSTVTPEQDAGVLIAVSALDPSLLQTASLLVVELDGLSGYPVYGEPLELGGASGRDAFALSRDFFGAGFLVTLSPEADSMRVEIQGPEGLLDSRGARTDGYISVAEAIVGVLATSGY